MSRTQLLSERVESWEKVDLKKAGRGAKSRGEAQEASLLRRYSCGEAVKANERKRKSCTRATMNGSPSKGCRLHCRVELLSRNESRVKMQCDMHEGVRGAGK